jgi:two-component system LytT family sensor kinase
MAGTVKPALRGVLRNLLRNYARYFLIWTVFGLFLFTQGLLQKLSSHDPTPWWHYLASWLTGVYLWALLTPAVIWLSNRFPIARRNWLRRVALHVPLSVAISLVQLVAESAILPRLGVFPAVMKTFGVTLAVLLIIGLHQSVMTYWMILAVEHGLMYYRGYQERKQQALRLEVQAARLSSQLVRAQLSALKMQLQPHFLFNTLNAIMVLVRQQKGRQAEEMVARLSDLLRCVLEDVEAQEVPLRRELEYLELYLSIEQVRFQDRLRVEIAADPGVLEAAVPHMGLQPIVENAIRHGIGRSSAAGKIRIGATRVHQMLQVTVRDDGPGLRPSDEGAGRGIGLTNTRARLRQLYGEAAQLTVENVGPGENGAHGGAIATMVLPYRLAPCASEKEVSETEVMEVHAFDNVDRG